MRDTCDFGKIGWLLGGGGGKAHFQAGVEDTLHHYRLYPSYLGATSGGVIPASKYIEVTPDMAEFERAARVKFGKPPFKINPEVYWRWLGANSILDNSPLRELVGELNMKKIADSLIEFRVLAANAQTGRHKIFSNHDSPSGVLAKAIIASTAIPLIFRAEEIDGEVFFDGGGLYPHPLEVLVKDARAWGCDTIIVVETEPPGYRVPVYKIMNFGLVEMLLHRFGLTDQWSGEGVDLIIRPTAPLIPVSLRWRADDPVKMRTAGKIVTETLLREKGWI